MDHYSTTRLKLLQADFLIGIPNDTLCLHRNVILIQKFRPLGWAKINDVTLPYINNDDAITAYDDVKYTQEMGYIGGRSD
jgi:hypothetical protein